MTCRNSVNIPNIIKFVNGNVQLASSGHPIQPITSSISYDQISVIIFKKNIFFILIYGYLIKADFAKRVTAPDTFEHTACFKYANIRELIKRIYLVEKTAKFAYFGLDTYTISYTLLNTLSNRL